MLPGTNVQKGGPVNAHYTLQEVAGLYRGAGFEVVEQRQYIAEDTHENIKSIQQRLIDLAKVPFYVVPHFRGSLMAVGRKPVGM